MRELDTLLTFKLLGDDRGSLIALEEQNDIPFAIKRVYYIFDTEEGVRRGFHAHKELQQVAVCIKGSCTFLMDDGINKKNIVLNSSEEGLLIPPMVWHEMFDFSEDCVVLVLADELYDEADYIRNYETFLNHGDT